MATIDPNIAMGYKPIQVENPLNQLAAMTQIQSGQQGQQLNALKLQEAQLELEDRNKLRGLDINSPDFISNVSKFNPKLALTLQKDLAAYKKSGLETTELQGKISKQEMDRNNQNLRNLSRNPSNANIQAYFEDFVLDNPNEAQKIANAQRTRDYLLSADIPTRNAYLSSIGATASDLKPVIQNMDVGGSIIPRVLDAYSGLPISTGQPIVKTPTIADKISQQRLKLDQDKILREQTMGTIPAGYRLNKDTNELEAIPGGPTTVPLAPKELQAREAKFPQATTALKTFDSTSDNLIKDLERLKNHPGLSNITGVIAGRTPSLTVQGREAQALYDKIIARGGFQELQSLRQSSPTGGALGNVSNQEGQSLRQAFGALDRTQDASSIRNEIDRLVENIGGAKTRVREAFDMTYDYKNTTPRSNAAPPAAPNQTKSGATVSNW